MTEYKSFYKRVGGNEGNLCNYPTRLDTYGKGCSNDCKYCYAKSLLDFRGLWNPSDMSVADLGKVVKKLNTVDSGTVLRLGGMTDCFAPIERVERVTYGAISEMNRLGIGYLIVTKSALVADDEYMELYDPSLAHIQVSVTATDDLSVVGIENASPPSQRIDAIEKLHDAGFDVTLRLSPYVPEWIDVDKLNSVRCDKLLVEFLRVNSWIRKWLDIDYSQYTLNHGGYSHLPLDRKIELLDGLDFPQMSVCDDVPSHYDWFMKNFNYNKDDCCNLRLAI